MPDTLAVVALSCTAVETPVIFALRAVNPPVTATLLGSPIVTLLPEPEVSI